MHCASSFIRKAFLAFSAIDDATCMPESAQKHSAIWSKSSLCSPNMLKEERYHCSLLYASCEVYAHVPALGEGMEVVVGPPLPCELMKANLFEITACEPVLSCPSAGLNLAGKRQAENPLSVIKFSGRLRACRKSQVAFSTSLDTVFNMLLASLPEWGAGQPPWLGQS